MSPDFKSRLIASRPLKNGSVPQLPSEFTLRSDLLDLEVLRLTVPLSPPLHSQPAQPVVKDLPLEANRVCALGRFALPLSPTTPSDFPPETHGFLGTAEVTAPRITSSNTGQNSKLLPLRKPRQIAFLNGII